jgi:7,8-dihydroneopterin aldolase/epimerase/oxygenase
MAINKMDIIFLKGLRIDTIIGIYDWERTTKQPIIIDLEISTDIRQAATTDDIEQTTNYKSIAKRIINFVEHSQFQLVETLTEKIAEMILDEFDVDWLKLTLNKTGAISGANDVGIIIERRKSQNA